MIFVVGLMMVAIIVEYVFINKINKKLSSFEQLLSGMGTTVLTISADHLKEKVKTIQYFSESGNLSRTNITDAGMDISSQEDYVLKPGERHLFSTDIYLATPIGSAVIAKPRSGLAVKYGIDVLAGVIDEDYTGEVKVLLINLGQEDFTVSKNDRIAQLVLMNVNQNRPRLISSSEFNCIKEHKGRGTNGFGSSGI
jgi:dUTP pyrophosphatase